MGDSTTSGTCALDYRVDLGVIGMADHVLAGVQLSAVNEPAHQELLPGADQLRLVDRLSRDIAPAPLGVRHLEHVTVSSRAEQHVSASFEHLDHLHFEDVALALEVLADEGDVRVAVSSLPEAYARLFVPAQLACRARQGELQKQIKPWRLQRARFQLLTCLFVYVYYDKIEVPPSCKLGLPTVHKHHSHKLFDFL